jgi:peptide/nickel transport system permease protein
MLLSLIMCATFCFVVFDFSLDIDMNRRLAPLSHQNPFGTDELGRDLLSCILFGLGLSTLVSLSVVAVSGTVGMLVGMISGLTGGVVDGIIMRLVDLFLAFPGILLSLVLVSVMRPGVTGLIFVLAMSGWVEFARIIRAEVLRWKEMEFLNAARGFNASFLHILFRHLFPLIFPLAIVQATVGIGSVILVESSINFLGLGFGVESPTLGYLIDSGRSYIYTKPELILLPGTVLFWLILSFNLVGEGLRKHATKM